MQLHARNADLAQEHIFLSDISLAYLFAEPAASVNTRASNRQVEQQDCVCIFSTEVGLGHISSALPRHTLFTEHHSIGTQCRKVKIRNNAITTGSSFF